MNDRPAESMVKTKIVATIGPSSGTAEKLEELVLAGVDVFRLNFAHGAHDWLAERVQDIRSISKRHDRPIAILGDLSGPKIRLGELPEEGLALHESQICRFAREADETPTTLTSTYDQLIDDVTVGDRILMADGTVSLRVVQTDDEVVTCVVVQPGLIRSRQGINLPGVALSTPSITEKDRADLEFAIQQDVDFVGLSFVRSAQDIRDLRALIDAAGTKHPPQIVAKIEKAEAIDDLEQILDVTDAVMVARGDLGVEVDITRVPVLQKYIIRMSNKHRVPVITATQMLDSMQSSELPTRAEASDVANAVLDGTDAVMLSGETAIGDHPVKVVRTMSKIAYQAEQLVRSNDTSDPDASPRRLATPVTEAVAVGASTTAEHLGADLLVVATHTGRTAMAVSKLRSPVPILALSDLPDTAQRACLYWGVTPCETRVVDGTPHDLITFVEQWSRATGSLKPGNRVVIIGSTRWTDAGHDLMVVHEING